MAIAIVGMLDEREEALEAHPGPHRAKRTRDLPDRHQRRHGGHRPRLEADVTRDELAELAEKTAGLAVGRGDAPAAVMTEGLKAKIRDLHGRGELQGIIAITGMTGALISLPAMKELPFGVPKLLISGATGQPVHAAKFGDYFARRDITVMHTVVDTVGMNPLVRALALNGADAISGMVEGGPLSLEGEKAVHRGDRVRLLRQGRATTCGRSWRTTTRSSPSTRWAWATRPPWIWRPRGSSKRSSTSCPGRSASIFWAGTGTPGPDRLDVAAALPIPYIFCPGGFDMISCGPLERRDRDDASVDIAKAGGEEALRPTAESPGQDQRRGDGVDRRRRRGQAEPVPRTRRGSKRSSRWEGFSSLSVEGGPLHDPAADRAFSSALCGRASTRRSRSSRWTPTSTAPSSREPSPTPCHARFREVEA